MWAVIYICIGINACIIIFSDKTVIFFLVENLTCIYTFMIFDSVKKKPHTIHMHNQPVFVVFTILNVCKCVYNSVQCTR